MAEFLLQNGANVNQIVDKDKQQSFLMQLCDLKELPNLRGQEINIIMIKFFVNHGADVFLKDAADKDCYDLIENNDNRDEIVHLFECYESNILISNAYTPLTCTNRETKQKKIRESMLTSVSSSNPGCLSQDKL